MSPAATRPFEVRSRALDRHHGRVLVETSCEAAAVAFLEDHHHASGDEVQVIVRDLDLGVEHCFSVDAASGEVAPCG